MLIAGRKLHTTLVLSADCNATVFDLKMFKSFLQVTAKARQRRPR